MDINEYLIILKEEDKTSEVENFEPKNETYNIYFLKNPKPYSYNRCNAKIYVNPTEIDANLFQIRDNHKYFKNIKKLLKFGPYIKIFFNDNTTSFHLEKDLKIEKTTNLADNKSVNVFEYLKDLSDVISLKTDDGKNLLRDQYEKLNTIDSDSILSYYLNPKPLKQKETLEKQIIFPFGFNQSQKVAIENVFKNNISIIEGPPGTGKTQTILNIIANIVYDNETVAVVSNNNSATSNVLEKLEFYELNHFAAFLGKKENKENFIKNQNRKNLNYDKWVLPEEDKEKLFKKIETLSKELNDKLEVKNLIAKLEGELFSTETEKSYFDSYSSENDYDDIYYPALEKLNSDQLLTAWVDLQHTYEKKNRITKMFKIKNVLRFKFMNQSIYDNSVEKMIINFQKRYYNMKINEIKKELTKLKNQLERYQFDSKMEELSQVSMLIFKDHFADKYKNSNTRKEITLSDLFKNPENVLSEYPLILSTTHSLRSSLGNGNIKYDYLIIDEASQVDIISGALALSCAKNLVIVGDLKQLSNVVSKEARDSAVSIYSQYDLHSAYDYVQNSLLSSITSLFEKAPRALLKEHYRCHPKIVNFCNQKFYNDELIIMTSDNKEEDVLKAYLTVKGNHARGNFNQRQIDVIKTEIMPSFSSEMSSEIGIISPYRDQAHELNQQIIDNDIEIDTVHKYQGREKDNIIISTVDNVISEFTDSPNLLNVAVSRAKKKLLIVVSNDEQNTNTNIGDLVRYIQYNNLEIVQSKVSSIFDLLYKNYESKRKKMLRWRVSDYDSENLMYRLIKSILIREKFRLLDVFHVIH